MTAEQANPAHELKAQGWIRRFDIETERADEYVEVYESIGDEVWVVRMIPELMVREECAARFAMADYDKYVIIYTRRIDSIRNGYALH
jgi:hypothetical protein